MAFDADFLSGVFAKEDVKAEDKVKLILAEHEASERGLVSKRDELLGEIKNLKEKVVSGDASLRELTERNNKLAEEIKSKNPDDLKKMLEQQFAVKEADFKKQLETVIGERDKYRHDNLQHLFNSDIEEATKGLDFVGKLKDGFVSRVKELYQFEPREIDGRTAFLTKDMKAVKDVVHEFALTDEGKSYIKNPATGGGAKNDVGNYSSSTGGTKTMTRSQYNEMSKKEPQKVAEFFRNGGKITDD